MGSIVEKKRTDQATGKTVTQYRAHIRRAGFASRSKVFATRREALEWLRNNENDAALERTARPRGKTLADLIGLRLCRRLQVRRAVTPRILARPARRPAHSRADPRRH